MSTGRRQGGPMPPAAEQLVERIVGWLVDGEYDTVAAFSHNDRMTTAQMRDAVEEYGRTLLRLPPGWLDTTAASVIPIDYRHHAALAVSVDFHTVEEGHSDLTLQLEVFQTDSGEWGAMVENILIE